MSVEVCAECDIAECHHIRARRAEEAKHPTTLVAMVPLHYHLAAVAEAEARGMRRAAEMVRPKMDCDCNDCATAEMYAAGIEEEASRLEAAITEPQP